MLHIIKRTQILDTSLDRLWEFISHPDNLKLITPPEMNFLVLSDVKDKKMYAGQIIEYYVSPLKGFTAHWVTEITQVREKEFFIDEQRFGPYRFWHHQHSIRSTVHGIEMTDIIHYKLPLGWLGRLINSLFVKHKLEYIFNYRYDVLQEIFNGSEQSRLKKY